jgi:hypothetical protein
MKHKAKYIKSRTPSSYPIYVRVGVRSQGRPRTKLGVTIRNLLVGDAFFYPYTTPRSIYRLADELFINLKTTKTPAGYWVERVGELV